MSQEGVRLFGVRHHGPGSARSLVNALHAYAPTAVLIEGPPDANELLPLASHVGLEPPVALLVYAAEVPEKAAFFPFARFSPEWQAIRFALERGVPVRFIDLPQSLRLPDPPVEREPDESSPPGSGPSKSGLPKSDPPGSDPSASGPSESDPPASDPNVAHTLARGDPLQPVAWAAGYSDTERWWDHLVESREGRDLEVFEAIHEMMCEVRTQLEVPLSPLDQRREAFMRKSIRAAKAEGFERIAVVCGAYHTPALADMPPARKDDEILRGLARVKTNAAWVPWSYERLSTASGYGAGIESPAWYELLWEKRAALGPEWVTRAARLLRQEDVPASSAHVIEACRLADALAAVRGRPVPGLVEYNDATIAVLGAGDALNLRLIQRRWHFDARLGRVPEDFPTAPLQRDLTALQKRLRLPPAAEEKTLDLDLREQLDRERSHMLRRLRIVGVEWAKPARQGVASKGTFHEIWQLRWDPELSIALVEASRYGHTLQQAAASMLAEKSASSRSLPELVKLLDDALFADLAEAIRPLVSAIEQHAAAQADVLQMLDALPPLVSVYRYGNVRQTDVGLVAEILATLVPRVLIGLVPASGNIDADAARELWKRMISVDQGLAALGNAEFIQGWRDCLRRLAERQTTHPLIAGYASRLLYDAKALDFDTLATALSQALSLGNQPEVGADWVEGLLSGSGALLIHDDRLRTVVDGWLRSVSDDHFLRVLPLLRRTFSRFPNGERRIMGQLLRSKQDATGVSLPNAAGDFDAVAARALVPILTLIWGGESSNDL